MSMKQVGTLVLNPGLKDETWGYCTMQEVALEADKQPLSNGQGETKGIIYTDCGRKKFSGTWTPLDVVDGIPEDDDLIGEEGVFTRPDGSTLKIQIDNAKLTNRPGNALPEFAIDGYYYPGIHAEATPPPEG